MPEIVRYQYTIQTNAIVNESELEDFLDSVGEYLISYSEYEDPEEMPGSVDDEDTGGE
jgi:hypothetical protein